jgi:hypothetical protein
VALGALLSHGALAMLPRAGAPAFVSGPGGAASPAGTAPAAPTAPGGAKLSSAADVEHREPVEAIGGVDVQRLGADDVVVRFAWRGHQLRFELTRARGIYSGAAAAERHAGDATRTFHSRKAGANAAIALLAGGGVEGVFQAPDGLMYEVGTHGAFRRRLGSAFGDSSSSSSSSSSSNTTLHFSQLSPPLLGCGEALVAENLRGAAKRPPGGANPTLRGSDDGSATATATATLPLQTLPAGQQCYEDGDVLHALQIGLILDPSFLAKFASEDDALLAVELMLVATNLVYRDTFNVLLVAKATKVVTASAVASEPALEPFASCASNIHEQLGKIQQYSRGLAPSQELGHWHLLGGCSYGNIVGVAFLDAVCQEGGYNTGTSVVGWTPLWLTFAHEMGHQFGGRHDNPALLGTLGGIMDYGSGHLLGTNTYGFTTESQQSMCGVISNVVRSGQCPYFAKYSEVPSYCGDRVLDDGEECECKGLKQTQCGNCRGCKLVRAQECSNAFTMRTGGAAQVSEAQCCDDEGRLAPGTTLCNGGAGHCGLGKCLDLCGGLNLLLAVCGMAQGGCRQQCEPRDHSQFCSQWWVTVVQGRSKYVGNMPDGTRCQADAGAGGRCSAGSCVAQDDVAPPAPPTRRPTTRPPSALPSAPVTVPPSVGVERTALKDGRSCWQLSRQECCLFKDGSPERKHFDDPCVPALPGTTFHSGGINVECQVQGWTMAEHSRRARADYKVCGGPAPPGEI